MDLLVIGGARSGAGKTALACRLLPRLPGFGAVKLSTVETGGGHGLTGEYEIRIAPTILQRPGSDTARLLAAGARGAVWLVARRPAVPLGLARALSALGPVPGAIVEGNSAADALPSARVVCVLPADAADLKPSAGPVLARAERVVVAGAAGALPAGLARVRDLLSGDREGRLRALCFDDPAGDGWLDEIAAWFRR